MTMVRSLLLCVALNSTHVLDTVWQLNGLSNWVIRFTERLMKECVLSRDTSQRSSQSDKDSQVDPGLSPYALNAIFFSCFPVNL